MRLFPKSLLRANLQNGTDENALSAIGYLVRSLNIPVSNGGIRNIKLRSGYPNLLSLSETLTDWHIENMAVRLSLGKLSEIPFPAIAHIDREGGQYVVLKKIDKGQTEYFDPSRGLVSEPLADFEKKWSGVTLLVQPNAKSGEENYEQKRQDEILGNMRHSLVWTLLCSIIFVPALYFPIQSYFLYALKVLGSLVTFALLQKQFGNPKGYLSSFCRIGGNSDCDAVIHSRASRIFGIHLSELGVLYFSGGALAIILTFPYPESWGTLVLLNLLVLPFTLFSIYYQAFVLRKWCPLCVLVMSIFWLESFILVQFSFSSSMTNIYLSIMSFSLPLVFWLAIRKSYEDVFRLAGLERHLEKFVKSERIFQRLLDNQTPVHMGDFPFEIQIGPAGSLVTMTIVSSPICGPCGLAHSVIKELLLRFEDRIRVVFRFSIPLSEKESIGYRMLEQLIKISMTSGPLAALTALTSWYTRGGTSKFNRWIHENPVSDSADPDLIVKVMLNHSTWCKQTGIAATPTVFINGRKLPEEYSVNDLKYQIGKLLEKEEVNEPVQAS